MSGLEVTAISVAGIAVYVVLAGFVFSKVKNDDEDSRLMVAGLWPLAALLYIAWWLATLAPRWVKRREQAAKVPKATAREVQS